MEVSLKGLIEIAGHEGIVLSPYLDSVGVWTIFIGHTKPAGEPDPLSFPKGVEQPVAEAIRVFKQDMRKFEARVNDAVKVPVNQHEFDALVSFDFNTGGIYRAKITEYLNKGDRPKAILAFNNWHRPPEIIGRRNKERDLFKTGVYLNGGKVTVFPADSVGRVNYSKGKQVDLADLLTTSPIQRPPEQSTNQSQNQPQTKIESQSCFSMLRKLLSKR